MTRFARRFRRIARKLAQVELMETSMDASFADLGDDDDFGLRDREQLDQRVGAARFLNFYGDVGLRHALESYDFLPAIERRGFLELELETQADDDRHSLITTAAHPDLRERVRVYELVVRRDRLMPHESHPVDGPFEVLTVDWLMMCNPAKRFTPNRPMLPGQTAPGLGLGEECLEILYRVVERLRLDGLVTVAEHFHNAVLYRRELKYFGAEEEGLVIALEDALLHREALSLAQASWAIEWGFVKDEEGEVVTWTGEAMVRGMNEQLVEYLSSKERKRLALERAASTRYDFDRAGFMRRWELERPVLEGEVTPAPQLESPCAAHVQGPASSSDEPSAA